jgi:hypothetical protein
VPSAPTTTFLAHGNKSISLCYLNKAAKVTCTPVAHTAMLEGVEVSYFQKNGYNLIRFSPVPPIAKFSAIKTRIKAPVTFTARAFMVGLNKAAVVLEHHAARHTNDLPMPSVIEAGGCTYDDGGGLSCDGGGGGDGGESDPGGDMGCGDCSYPGDPDPDQPPDQDSVPATNANDPCTVVDGTTVCVMTGPRPMPAPIPTPPPVGSIPPVVGIPPIDQLPSGPAPWFPTVDWCSLLGLGCPANPPKGSYMDQPQYQEDIAACQKQYELDIIECNFYPNDSRMAIACRARAGDYNAACLTAAREAARAREP